MADRRLRGGQRLSQVGHRQCRRILTRQLRQDLQASGIGGGLEYRASRVASASLRAGLLGVDTPGGSGVGEGYEVCS